MNAKYFTAKWIAPGDIHPTGYGVYHFRKTFALKSLPHSFSINVSADNRYRLFVNGVPVTSGPAAGDRSHWNYETIDIASYLHSGLNTIAAIVWNMGEHAGLGQVSVRTAFILSGTTKNENLVGTDTSWKVCKNDAYAPCSLDTHSRLHAYYVTGPGDAVNGTKYPWGWEDTNFDDTTWQNAIEININDSEAASYWNLKPRTIPLFHEQQVRFASIRRVRGIDVKSNFISGMDRLQIPVHTTVNVLIDMGVATVAYPEIILSNGKGAHVELIYAEALFEEFRIKGNRNEIENKEIIGNFDIFCTDGAGRRQFRPLWIRAYRYIQINVVTQDEPLVLEDIYSMTNGYPLFLNASFTSDDESLSYIWEAGWRTLKLCAADSFYDTPYYEQLQYVGDSRIQALITLYTSGDDRLAKKAILDFHRSILPDGLTQSRYPCTKLQVIPAFSLFWITMIHDYWMHRRDDIFLQQLLPAIDGVISWFRFRIDDSKKMLGPLTGWNFVDWDNFNGWGTAPGAEDGNSSIITLHFAYTLKQVQELFAYFAYEGKITNYHSLAEVLNQGTFRWCYNPEKGLIADTPEQKSYSQHAGIWAILAGTGPQHRIRPIMNRLLNDNTIGQVTYFYRFYLTQALKKAGLADLYYSLLTPWREMIGLGLTTFAEKPEPTRSDCHGWSASPNYDFLATICGIMPASPGFRRVVIKPALGKLTEVSCTVPVPDGLISVKLKKIGNEGINAEIILPKDLTGTFKWNGTMTELTGGKQLINC